MTLVSDKTVLFWDVTQNDDFLEEPVASILMAEQ
jgi:hypothetical protein